MNRTQIANRMKGQVKQFSGILSKGLPKVVGRFVAEMVYGIVSQHSVHVARIARSLNERIRLIKTLNRLCRQLGRKGLEEKLRENLIEEGSGHVDRDTLLIADISDVSKKYAKKMEHLANIRDASEEKITKGYWTMKVIGAEVEKGKIIPLYEHLYSQDAPDFVSENEEILKGVECLRKKTEGRGIWVMDRGGDRGELMIPLLDRQMRFIIRLKGDRNVIYHGHAIIASQLASSTKMLYVERIVREESGGEKAQTIEFGFRRVRFPGRKERLFLVVVRGFGAQPLMLLTSLPVKPTRKSLFFVVEAYIRRWQIEETIRFEKQTYGIEDIRLRRYTRLQNMIAVTVAVAYFVAVWLGDGLRLPILTHHALAAAKRLFSIPDFRYYALADGIKWAFEGYQTPFWSHPQRSRADPQIMLPI